MHHFPLSHHVCSHMYAHMRPPLIYLPPQRKVYNVQMLVHCGAMLQYDEVSGWQSSRWWQEWWWACEADVAFLFATPIVILSERSEEGDTCTQCMAVSIAVVCSGNTIIPILRLPATPKALHVYTQPTLTLPCSHGRYSPSPTCYACSFTCVLDRMYANTQVLKSGKNMQTYMVLGFGEKLRK